MSVRTEPRELSQQLQQTLTITPEMMASQAAMVNAGAMVTAPMTAAPADALATDQQLHQANDFNTNNEHHPLERTVCINIRASLSDLCLRADTATWAPPSAEATRSIFQQAPYGAWNPPPEPEAPPNRQQAASKAPVKRKFLDLGGSAENQGDLKSVVLHKMTLGAHKSTFPIALGVRLTGVDDSTFSQTGESYSMIAMPNADSHNARVLQEDNTELVKQQVESQIKVRDLSHTSMSIAPADYANWHDVRTELMSEAKTGFKARVEAELAAAQGECLDELKAAFQQEERAIEHEIDHSVHTFSASVDVSYNFLSH